MTNPTYSEQEQQRAEEQVEDLRNGGEDYWKIAYDLQCRVNQLEEANRWIPCSERLPDDKQIVDVWTPLACGYRIPSVRWEWNGGSEGFWDWHFADENDAREGEPLQMYDIQPRDITPLAFAPTRTRDGGASVIDVCTLPIGRTFSCPVEQIIWLARHQKQPLVMCWWIGFEAAQRGACFDRVIWELENRETEEGK